jgi:hypothetical protein
VKNVRNKPKEAVKEEIGDILEEVNYKMEINCMFLDILKLHLILRNYQKRPSNSWHLCLAMDSEKLMIINEALFRYIDLGFFSWSTKDKNGNPITLIYKNKGATDWNPLEK